MESSLPDWLNKDFLTKVLQHKECNKSIVVNNFTATSAAPAGNNYGSLVIRVTTEYRYDATSTQPHLSSLIIKTDHVDGVMKGMFLSDYKETMFYYEFLPKVKKFIQTDFLPESFHSPVADAIVLEDLKEKGFVMADKKKTLDFEHCCLYLRTAADLHAGSVAVYHQDPEFIQTKIAGEKLFQGPAESFMRSNLNLGVKAFVDAMEKNVQFVKHAKIIKNVAPSLFDMLIEAHKPSKVVNSFNQGDSWTTNMMFKYGDDGKVCGIKLLDFQIPRFASPVNDLAFFLWSSANHDVMENRLVELYDIYLERFNGKLEELNCPERLTRVQFMKNMKLLSPVVIFAVAAMVPFFICGNASDVAEMKEAQENKNVKSPYDRYYTKEYCANHLSRLVRQMEKEGVFDYFEKCKNSK